MDGRRAFREGRPCVVPGHAHAAGAPATGHVREIARSKLGRTMNPRTPWRREELALLESWSGTDASFQATLPGKPDQMSPTVAAVPAGTSRGSSAHCAPCNTSPSLWPANNSKPNP